jgi:hypothetical protein
MPEMSMDGDEGHPYDSISSSRSDDGGSDGIGQHDDHGVDEDRPNEPPIIEEDAFAQLMEAHFGVHSSIEGETSTPHENHDNEEWAELDSLARTPLYTGATSSRYYS